MYRRLAVNKDNGDVFVLERGAGRIVVLFDDDGDGKADAPIVIATFAAQTNNDALLLHYPETGVSDSAGNLNIPYLFASSDTQVFRWSWDPKNPRASLQGQHLVIVDGILPGGHATRALVVDRTGLLYVTQGSAGNHDNDEHRASMRRFNGVLAHSPAAQSFTSGELVAEGLRNEADIDIDQAGVIWGVENGLDNVLRPSLGGDIHKNSPAEELNRFDPDDIASMYGYPYCWLVLLLFSRNFLSFLSLACVLILPLAPSFISCCLLYLLLTLCMPSTSLTGETTGRSICCPKQWVDREERALVGNGLGWRTIPCTVIRGAKT